MGGGPCGTPLEYVVPKSMERVASAAEVEYVLPNSVGGVATINYVLVLNVDFWTESKNFRTMDFELQHRKSLRNDARKNHDLFYNTKCVSVWIGMRLDATRHTVCV